MMEQQFAGVKRNYTQMIDHVDANLAFDGVPVAYHEMSRGGYYTPPPPPGPQHTLFSNPFPSSSPDVGYVEEGYLQANHMYNFNGNPNRSMSEGYIHAPGDSFGGSSSASSSCNASLGPATPPPPQVYGPTTTKFPAVPITPSHVQPRQKAKRTATACEECRKRKQKCDGESPCQSCKEQKLECKYREVQPTKKDNSVERLVSLVESCSRSIEALTQRVDLMSTTLQQIEKRLTRCYQCSGTVDLETGTCQTCKNNAPCRLYYEYLRSVQRLSPRTEDYLWD
ncbi:unnamed protein product [Cercospora beticola]|nr:unnamed protein product [Cercospora beticola]